MSEFDDKGYELLAERLCAAYMSAQMGFASVDYVIKRYVRTIKEPPSPLWFEIAALVSDVMTQVKPLAENAPAAGPAENGTTALAARNGRARRRGKKGGTGLEN